MNPEEARKNLDAKLSQIGYVHPTESDISRQPQYMAYSVTDELKKNGDYVSQKAFDPYATFDTENSSKEQPNICPMCEQKAMYSCSCSLQDMMCSKGHVWFVLKNGTIKIGDPHEEEN